MLTRQRADEAQQVLELKQAAVEAEREKEELRRRRREEATRRRVAKEKVACLQLVRQVLPLSLDRAFEELSAKSWVTPTIHQVRDEWGREPPLKTNSFGRGFRVCVSLLRLRLWGLFSLERSR